MKYLKNFSNHDVYNNFIIGKEFTSIQEEQNAIVSYCRSEEHVHYNPYIPPKAKLLDILYSDINGNLSFTSEVLPVSEGKTPIGLCIAGTEFFGNNEPARWMSLKFMNCTTPETGSIDPQGIYWGNYGNDISTIDNITVTYADGSMVGYMNVDYYDNSSEEDKLPNVLNENGNWNISILGTVNQYIMTDIDGKNKTDKILATTTLQSTWQTDTTITNNPGGNYAPAACCCWRYHTLGTQAADWYLGACGEMCMILAKKTDINIKLNTISTTYPNDCIKSLDNLDYWSSTESGGNGAYYIVTSNGKINTYIKAVGNHVLAILQYN